MGRPAHPARLKAIEAGEKIYFTGEPCNLGFVAGRTVSENKCQCEAHLTRRKESMRRRYQKNRSHRIGEAAKWAKQNQEKKREAARKWAKENADNVHLHTHKRRAMKAKALPKWFSDFDKLAFTEAYKLAKQRSIETGIPWEVDHIVPLFGKKVCGLHVSENIQVIPRRLNRMKSNKYPV